MAEPKYNPKTKKWKGIIYSHTDTNGKRVYHCITAASKREWKQAEAEYKALKKGKESTDMTVRECVDRYIDSKAGVLSPSTIRGYLSCQKRMTSLEHIMISRLDSADIQYFVSDMSARLSPKTVKDTYSLLMAAVSTVDDRRFKVTLPARPPLQYNTPDTQDVTLLLNHASSIMKVCILLAAVGTLRRGEICALEYDDILYDFSAVFVHRSIVRTPDGEWIVRDMPKTSGSVRRVVLPKEVIDMIGTGEGRIIPFTPSALSERFIRLRNRLGLSCRFHDLRHYAASFMHAIGVPDKYIMERGGWTDDRILKSVYQNTLTNESKRFTAMTNDYFSENVLLKKNAN